MKHQSYRLRSTFYVLRTDSRGASLIDVVVGSALMLVVFMGISAAFRLAVEVVSNNSARRRRSPLSGERMEYIRSLSYDGVGTVGGIPAGSITQSETVVLNGISYTRRTFIAYVDDPADGTGASDANSIPLDYKVARVDVSWASKQGDRHISTRDAHRASQRNGNSMSALDPVRDTRDHGRECSISTRWKCAGTYHQYHDEPRDRCDHVHQCGRHGRICGRSGGGKLCRDGIKVRIQQRSDLQHRESGAGTLDRIGQPDDDRHLPDRPALKHDDQYLFPLHKYLDGLLYG